MIDVIVPVYNEQEGVKEFHRRISEVPLALNLLFIDNASTDNTLEIIKSFDGATIIEHRKNEGYGGSICDGIGNSDGEIIVIIDADGEYSPESIPEMVRKLETSDVVYGSRFLGEGNPQMPWSKRLGNRIISSIFNLLFGQQVTDLYTGFKALKRSALDGVRLERKGFEHVLEMGVRLSRKGIAIDEIPIRFSPRHTDRSKMRHLSETLKFLWLTVCYFFEKKRSPTESDVS
ncbi:MAG: hypothetical protein A2V70_10105 [Planctomycetes bacterium RBG_13_63_9]|nr:MAG: hypothetical protein A2V70_10105 [Planctomycetes bacterium RBG_13_63_9]